MSRQKALALAPFISFFAMFAYLCVLKISGDPRFQDPNPEFGWFEHLWGAFTASGVVIVLIRSIWRAFRARQIGWVVAMFMVWPLAAVYVWKEE
jgi:hypothetical protein